MNMEEFAVATGDQPLYRTEDIQLGEGALDTKAQTVAPRPELGRHISGRALTLLSPHPRLQKQHPEGESWACP